MKFDDIAKAVGVRKVYIEKVSRQSSYMYKTYQIPKAGGRGYRTIHQPSKELKVIQRAIVKLIFSDLPIHERCYSYRKGTGIKDMATYHQGVSFISRIDLENFFESITSTDIYNFLKGIAALNRLTEDELKMVAKIVTKNGALTIGAPSSPAISNTILYSLDSMVHNELQKFDVKYSRYSDDIYISSNIHGQLKKAYEFIDLLLKNWHSPALKINEGKTRHASKRQGMYVTGIVLTPTGSISLGRNYKRKIKSLLHSASLGKLDAPEIEQLKGHISYINGIEPKFLISLRNKYPTLKDDFLETSKRRINILNS